MQGWIKLHRRVKGHWLFTEKRTFTKFEAWIDLLLEVNHKDNKFMLGGELVEVKRGQTITSIRQLCERWNWSNSKVTKFLKMLEADEMLVLKSDTKKTVITIGNYDIYQVQETEETTPKRQTHDTEATQKHTNKNDKNVKNEKEKTYSPQFEEWWSEYPRKLGKKKAFSSFKTKVKTHGYEKVLDGLKGYKQYLEREKTDERFIKHPSTFLNEEAFNDFIGVQEKEVPQQRQLTDHEKEIIEKVSRMDELMDIMDRTDDNEEFKRLDEEYRQLKDEVHRTG
jgi:hypothetical protein